MLNVKFYVLPNGKIIGFSILGHCGYEESGKDIVCAAVSSVVYMVINTFTDILNIEVKNVFIEEGRLEFILNENDEIQARTLLEGLKLHLVGLEEMYPKNIQINYVEV